LFKNAILAHNSLAQLLANALVAVVEPFDGGKVAFDARPFALSLFDNLDDGHRQRRFIGRQPRAAGALPSAAGRHLHGQAACLALHGWHRFLIRRIGLPSTLPATTQGTQPGKFKFTALCFISLLPRSGTPCRERRRQSPWRTHTR